MVDDKSSNKESKNIFHLITNPAPKRERRTIMAKEKTRIKIKDLPKGKKISKDEMKKVFGGYYPSPESFPPANWWKPFSK